MQSQNLEDFLSKIKITDWEERKEPRLICNLSFNNYSNRVNKVSNKKIKNLQRVKKDSFDEIWDQINQKYWTNIENIVIEYYWIEIIEEVDKKK